MRLGARALAAGRVEMVVTGPIHILVTLDWVKSSYARRLVTWPLQWHTGQSSCAAMLYEPVSTGIAHGGQDLHSRRHQTLSTLRA
jgi:hypothetical protein